MTRKLSTPFANDSILRNDVPVTASVDQTSKGVIGYTNGFTSINKLPLDSGGQPPHMEDVNGVLYDVTSNIVDMNKGIPQYFDSDYATLIGGYPTGARLVSNDNALIYVSTIENNTTDPNSSLVGWIVSEDKNKISHVDVVSDLDSLLKYDGHTVYVKSFYDPVFARSTPYLGGATYIYNSASASLSNDLTNRNGWVLQFTDELNVYQLGLKADGYTDETDAFNSICAKLIDVVKNSNTNKIIVSLEHSYLCFSNTVTLDLSLLGFKDGRIKALDTFKPTTYTPLVILKTSDIQSDVPITARKDFNLTFDNIDIRGNLSAPYSIGLLLQPDIANPMQEAIFNKVKIINFDYGLVYDENSYLVTFANSTFTGNNVIYSTTFSLGMRDGDQTNMGENLRFEACTFANSQKVFELKKGTGLGCHFSKCSFDYNGGNVAIGFKTWFDMQAGSCEFTFVGCHFEAGNANSGLFRMFYLGYRSKVSIFGGEMLFSSTTYNPCEFFCFNNDNGQISIEGTRIYAPSVKYWANKGLGKFTPLFNSPNNGEVFITSDYTKSLALDPNINDAGVTDIFVARSYTTDRLESSEVKISKGTVSINGVTKNAIQVYKKNGGGTDDAFYLYIKRDPRSVCLSSCAIKMFLDGGNNSSNEVSYTLSLVKSRQTDAYGVPIELASTDFSSASWNIDTSTAEKELSVTALLTMDAYKNYNYYKLRCRLFDFPGQSTLNIVGVGFEETD